jgi:hypothetical protein
MKGRDTMQSTFVAWAIAAFVLIASAAWLGHKARKSGWGMFVDGRGRFSLTQMQLMLWTVVVLSLIIGVFVGRLVYEPSRAAGALNFAIPNELLLVMGISIGSAAVSTAIKTNKDAATGGTGSSPVVATRELTETSPAPAQALMVEEGTGADQAIDIAKFQNFWFTLILITAYISTAIATIVDAGTADELTELPGFDATFVTLLGISHAGYLAGKVPDRPGVPGTVIAFEPKQAHVGDPVTISAGDAVLSDVTEVRFGTELGTNLAHVGKNLTVNVPPLAAGQTIPVKVPVKLIAPGWKATASAVLEVI